MNYWKISLGWLAVLAVASCGHPGGGSGGSGGSTGSGGSGSCTVGTVGCPCDGTSCDSGLACADVGGGQTTCVTTGGGSGGTTASGGATGTGGATATGGATGTGGATATGGAGDVSGSGGTTASGGTTGSGGSSGPNLLANGDFSGGDTNWHFENGAASVNNGQYCETNITGSNALFGWQDMSTPLMLSAGQGYTLTYQASGSGGAVLHVKVAHAVSPYTPDDYETTPDDQLSGSLQTFTHTFTPSSADDNTGIAFFVMSGQNICLAGVKLSAD